MMKKKSLFVAVFLIVLAGGLYFYQSFNGKVASASYKTKEEATNIYVRFAMEAYDSIEKNYWGVSTTTQTSGAYNLPNIFELSLEKVLNKPGIANPTDRSSTAAAFAAALKNATSTQAEKDITLQAIAVALYNLQPVGRNALFSQEQEKNLRNEVSNINPASNLYSDLGISKGATVQEVNKAFEEKKSELSKATTTEAKAELAKADYAHKVLADQDKKALYDDKQIEPTVFERRFGSTIYLNVSQVAPTTLWEIATAIEKASTTPMDSLIIDFRGNIGGAMDFLPAFLGLFVGPDQYAFDLFSKGTKDVIRTTQPKFPEFDKYKEIAVLTDDKTQSTAELTTDALKRYHLAKSVGIKTKGWGTIENTYPLQTEIDPSTKYSLLLVNSLTVRNDNQPIEGNGVPPDVDTSKIGWQTEIAKKFYSTSLINALRSVASVPPLK